MPMYGSRESTAGRKRYKNNVNAISMNRILEFFKGLFSGTALSHDLSALVGLYVTTA